MCSASPRRDSDQQLRRAQTETKTKRGILSSKKITQYPSPTTPSREDFSEVDLLPGPVAVQLEDYPRAAKEDDVRVFRDHRVHVPVPRQEAQLRIRLVRRDDVANAGYSLDHLRWATLYMARSQEGDEPYIHIIRTTRQGGGVSVVWMDVLSSFQARLLFLWQTKKLSQENVLSCIYCCCSVVHLALDILAWLNHMYEYVHQTLLCNGTRNASSMKLKITN